jgi:hypothetical protein
MGIDEIAAAAAAAAEIVVVVVVAVFDAADDTAHLLLLLLVVVVVPLAPGQAYLGQRSYRCCCYCSSATCCPGLKPWDEMLLQLRGLRYHHHHQQQQQQ